ncbi:MAG: YidC/Oxa1 family insertase periplasmic-domain containing protein [Lacunisphaera sp.]
MDKKNTIIGGLFLVAAMASFYISSRVTPPAPSRPPLVAPTAPLLGKNEAQPVTPVHTPSDATLVASKMPAAGPADFVTLSNDFIEVKFTDHGGAIDSVSLKKYPAVQGQPAPYKLNAEQIAPALSLTDFPGADLNTKYALVSQTATDITYRAVVDSTLEVTRHYSLAKVAGRDDYQVRYDTTFRNLTDKAMPLPKAVLNLGTAALLNESTYGRFLNAGYFDGKNAEFIDRGELEGGGLLAAVGAKSGAALPFIERPASIIWASVKNQFFAMLLTPDQPGTGVRVQRVKVDQLQPDTDKKAYGITSYALFDLTPLAAGASSTMGGEFFAGPKEYKRISNTDVFKHHEDKVMQFDSSFYYKMFFTGFFAPMLLTMMTWIHTWALNWGLAIIITTLILKSVFLPLTLAASRSSKRMAKLNPLMKAMREKYKDNPQKVQTETLRLFKENKVNPVGGCVPMLITIPFFIAFYSMLQSASDLRFAHFLWVLDLSAPDTVGHIYGIPINIMPILMGATMIFQMRLTPTPATDNAQASMMKIMPWIFTIFCYGFPAGLALYSTINGLFTIVQQTIINRMPEPHMPALAGDGLKNVTPTKKKKG